MATESSVIDAIDRAILGILAREGRISFQDLALRIRLSATATAERVRRLERRGAIRGYAADVDPAARGLPLEALIDVRLAPGTRAAPFEAAVAAREEVEDMVHLTGRADYLLRVHCAGTAGVDALLAWLKDEAGAQETETRVVLRRVPVGPAR